MRNLLNFIIRYSAWFVFTFYVLISCILLGMGQSYQQAVVLTSANSVVSGVYSQVSDITGYFDLRTINRELQQNNARLENEVLNLKSELEDYKAIVADTVPVSDRGPRYNFETATVINNSIRHPRNYFTINRGYEQGVNTGMGVVDQNGVVGIVNVAGRNTARVISLLNETQHFSVKLKGTQFVGTLTWKGGDPTVAYMEEVPRHAKFNIGDTVVTSGYSTTFPEGIMIGTVLNRVKGTDDNFFILKLHLGSNFRNLSTVRVLKDAWKPELDSLASKDIEIDKDIDLEKN
ncbi:MAG: rod shape-determining protein MreC [Bacteroides sp.]|nr:rod shape-determining protein MreC [Bacteroides sp.]